VTGQMNDKYFENCGLFKRIDKNIGMFYCSSKRLLLTPYKVLSVGGWMDGEKSDFLIGLWLLKSVLRHKNLCSLAASTGSWFSGIGRCLPPKCWSHQIES